MFYSMASFKHLILTSLYTANNNTTRKAYGSPKFVDNTIATPMIIIQKIEDLIIV